MAQVYTVTASTSVVLITSLQAPNTVVLLSSIRYPGHIVGIRDLTGSNQIAVNPVIVSTMTGMKFYDGTSSILLNQPNGFLSLSSRDSSTWQLLNSIGFLTTLSNGFLEHLTSQTSYIQTTSTLQESVSSMIAGRITVTKNIEINGQTSIQGDITLGGSLDILSSARFYQDLYISSGLRVGGNVSFPSSVALLGALFVGSNLSTPETVTIQHNLTVTSNLNVLGALLPPFISTQTLIASLLSTSGGLQLAGSISTLSTTVRENATFLGTATFQNSTFVSGMTAVVSSFSADSLRLGGTLTAEGDATVAGTMTAGSFTAGSLSTLGSLRVSTCTASGETVVQGETNVLFSSIVRNLQVEGKGTISSVRLLSTLESSGDSSSYSSTFLTSSHLNIRGAFGIGQSISAPLASLSLSTGMSTFQDLRVGGNLVVNGLASFRDDSFVAGSFSTLSTLYIEGSVSTTQFDAKGQVFVDGNLFVSNLASASTLGAPISLSISTLTLSNTLVVSAVGTMPVLRMDGYPQKLLVGEAQTVGGYDVYVGGILQNRSTVSQTQSFDFTKAWVARDLYVSTFGGLSNLSSMTIGTTTFDYPFRSFNGLLLTGLRTDGLTSTNIVSASNQSTTFTPTPSGFGTQGYKIRYNGTSQWVAAGEGLTIPPAFPTVRKAQSLKASPNGYTWVNAVTGGFTVGARDVAYGDGKWVAVGSNSPMAPPTGTIQYSTDGLNWSDATGQVFPSGGYGEAIAYNGSNVWVAAGTDPGAFGLKYSLNGMTWTTGTSVFGGPLPPLAFYSVGFGGGKWFATAASGTTVWESINGSNWLQSIPANIGRRVYKYITLGTQSYWLGGGDTIPSSGGAPTTSIQFSITGGCNWVPIQTGGFTGACYDILHVPEWSTILAVGSNVAPTQNILQYTNNLQNWVATPVFQGAGFGLGYGPTVGPDLQPYFTGNLTTIFRSTLSSTYIKASTITASSFTGAYTADGSLLTAVGSYTSSILVSSLRARVIRTYDISAERLTTLSTTVQDYITVNRKTFLSAANIFLAAGNDSQSNGNIQTSATGAAWDRALDTNFEFYGNGIAGNSNTVNPFYVAAGADSRTLYTLQFSVNGRVWTPAGTGGFSYATSIGLKEAKSVVYNATLTQWVALGVDTGGTATIQYSSDGINWLSASGGFTDYGTRVKSANGRYVAIGNGGARYSLNGTAWSLSGPQIVFTALAYGTVILYGAVWLAVSESASTSYYSTDNGVNWAAFSTVASVPINDIHYANGLWIAVGGNQIRRSTDGVSWSAVTTTFGSDITFKSIAYNSDSATWVAGAESLTAANTIYRSTDSLTWTAATVGGFSTSVDNYGFGTALTTLGFATFATGKSAIDINVAVKPRILSISTLEGSPSTTITNFSLTNSNASNVFSSIVRGIAAAPNEFYKYVAVGDGATPQKTIARSVDGTAGSWIPAVTGGFTPSGYGITYAQDRWVATGDATTTLNTIQYSPDGGNWFGTNTAQGIRLGGRGIVAGVSSLTGTFVAVGKDTTTSTIVTSQDGYTWVPASGEYFNVQGNGVAAGLRTPATVFPGAPYEPCFVAVGYDTRGRSNTILDSDDGLTWRTATNGGFSRAGYGATYSFDKFLWVAVGEDSDSLQTIQVNTTGAVAGWVGIGSNGFTKAGYAVAYNSSLSTFFAVGEDLGGNAEFTIKTSPNGFEWFNVSSPSGFISQKNLGAANSVFTQGIVTQESIPYIDLANLVVYERTTPLLYTRPTIRLQSSFIAFNESLFVNTSSQMVIGSQTPVGSNALTVYGDVFTPSLNLSPLAALPMAITVSTLTISTLSTVSSLFTELFTTPSLLITACNAVPSNTTANQILLETTGGGGGWTGDNGTPGFVGNLILNNALYAYTIPQSVQYPQPIGIGAANSPGFTVVSQPNRKECVVDGSLGASTLSTFYLLTSSTYISASNVFFEDQYLSMVDSTDDSFLTTGNRIQFNASSMTFNSIVTLQTSTQRVGIYTRDPQFDLDVQCAAVLSNVYASTLNAPLLLLTLQSI
jgi:cytoskeletal protein CcmA (bactofilin family)